ncbi:ABC transporter permease [Sphingobacterium thalpophilum]|uniref:Macrolide export ATP-binding/permease protein MacB n=1 Tax=Sphingobacterium thalpophilum TaxID=259 RepID=A0A4V6KPP9_9SPHI|nr:ABC transporter permease [Sphingobacterium thalpophilum]VTR30638.1 Macrolide export ATP-binding/permease protein MacB [Sphingobacterium thalpophilum]
MNFTNFKIAWRNIRKKKIQNLINLIGLTCGITFMILVGAYIWDVHQVNSRIKNIDQQFLLQSTYKKEGFGINLTTIGALPKALYEEYPNLVANYYRLDGLTGIVSNGNTVYEEGMSLGDPSLLTMFGFELLAGNVNTALNNPFSVAITDKAAVKYFGKVNVLGENLQIKNFNGEKHDFAITAIVKTDVQNAIMDLTKGMHADIFLPIANETYFGRSINNWDNPYIAGYIELKPGVTPQQVDQAILNLVHKNKDKEFADQYAPNLRPLKTYYLDDNQGAIRKMIKTLSWVAIFILIMAIINFINFSIAQHITRLKEIGMRKIMGSSRLQLIGQLLTEYILIVAIAALISLPIYILVSPLFAHVLMRELPSLISLPGYFFGLLGLSILMIGLLAGLYPAIKLSNINILASVKNQFAALGDKQLVRKVLLFFQFAVALLLLVCTLIISKQVSLFITSDLGYNKDYLLTVQAPRDWSETGIRKMETVRHELLQTAAVKSVSLSYETPGLLGSNMQAAFGNNNDTEVQVQRINSDSYFLETYEIPLLAGTFLPRNTATNMTNRPVVINKKAMEDFGFSNAENAIGQKIAVNTPQNKMTIVGITDNFVANSLHRASPAIIWTDVHDSFQYRYLSIRLRPGQLSKAVQGLEKKWKELMPDAPFEYQFMDDRIKGLYETELQLQRAAQIASAVSLLIVILGLTGLISLSIHLRNKEVGIRKVLGASLSHLMLLFSKEYYGIFLLAVLVTVPSSYMIMQHWLQNYVIRIEINAFTYLLPLAILLSVLGLLVGAIVFRTTRFNPVEKLRDE